MQEVIDLIFYMLEKFWNMVFSFYIVEGVSVGMLFICCLIFSMLIRFVVAVPKAMPRKRYGRYDIYTIDGDTNAQYERTHYYKR